MNSNQTLYWLGASINGLTEKNKTIITKHFNIIELHDDVSIISTSSISLVAFNANDNLDLLHITLKLCVNLNKTLLIFHSSSLYIENEISERNYISINTKSSDLELEVKEIKKIVFKSNLNNKQLIHNSTNIEQNKESTRHIINIIDYIDKNLTSQLREVDVADYCHYSITYFSKYFHQEIGVSFREYVCSKRIGKAKKLLRENSNIKIAIIAYQCGYNDVSYFTRIFKKKTGMSPGTYRKEYLLKTII
ncbi:helix-turn-helix domain-containing protein [Aliivibrio wodanis]|uniref:helix-turn-helix domain-containing protein n=1 Tax=Aliivibrio wodanis TaxID=80852 RepID=UPI00406C3986